MIGRGGTFLVSDRVEAILNESFFARPLFEGDEDMFVLTDKEQIDTSKINNKLEQLQEILGKDSASGVKLEEMKERLKNSSFTRFWP